MKHQEFPEPSTSKENEMTLMTGIFASIAAAFIVLLLISLMIARYVVTARDMEGY